MLSHLTWPPRPTKQWFPLDLWPALLSGIFPLLAEDEAQATQHSR